MDDPMPQPRSLAMRAVAADCVQSKQIQLKDTLNIRHFC